MQVRIDLKACYDRHLRERQVQDRVFGLRAGSKNCSSLKVPGVEDVRVLILKVAHVVAKLEERRIPVARCLGIPSIVQRVVAKLDGDVFQGKG